MPSDGETAEVPVQEEVETPPTPVAKEEEGQGEGEQEGAPPHDGGGADAEPQEVTKEEGGEDYVVASRGNTPTGSAGGSPKAADGGGKALNAGAAPFVPTFAPKADPAQSRMEAAVGAAPWHPPGVNEYAAGPPRHGWGRTGGGPASEELWRPRDAGFPEGYTTYAMACEAGVAGRPPMATSNQWSRTGGAPAHSEGASRPIKEKPRREHSGPPTAQARAPAAAAKEPAVPVRIERPGSAPVKPAPAPDPEEEALEKAAAAAKKEKKDTLFVLGESDDVIQDPFADQEHFSWGLEALQGMAPLFPPDEEGSEHSASPERGSAGEDDGGVAKRAPAGPAVPMWRPREHPRGHGGHGAEQDEGQRRGKGKSLQNSTFTRARLFREAADQGIGRVAVKDALEWAEHHWRAPVENIRQLMEALEQLDHARMGDDADDEEISRESDSESVRAEDASGQWSPTLTYTLRRYFPSGGNGGEFGNVSKSLQTAKETLWGSLVDLGREDRGEEGMGEGVEGQ
eukprot:Hpha_TRINITY_DN34757_c0_g1::TRINITY_DN34757_c0_g1_i1::g.178005::m.178005